MNTNIVIVAILALGIGVGTGYFLAGGQSSAPVVHTMDATMSGMTAGLENKQGAEFEQVFITEMIVHHEGAVAMAQMVLQKTQRPELVQLANDIISAQTREIDMMRGWSAQWFGR